jgi:hypothetical protein
MPLSRSPTPDDLLRAARNEIVLQHEDLRRQLWSAVDATEDAAKGDEAAASGLAMVLTTLLGQLKCHIAFEESVLLPLLCGQGLSADAEQVVAEHARQVATFTQLLEMGTSTPALRPLARSFRLLVESLLVEMTGEEQKLLWSRIERPDVTADWNDENAQVMR